MRMQWAQHLQLTVLWSLLAGLYAPAALAHIANNPPGTAIIPKDGAHVSAPGGSFAVRATFEGACDVATRVSEDILSTSRKARLVRQKFDCSHSVWTWQGHVAHAAPGDTLDVVLDFEQNGYTRATTHYHGVSATYFVAP